MIAEKNILIIAYYFFPDKRVGALRASYWFNNLGSKMNCNVKVLTANAEVNTKNVHYIPIKKKTNLSNLIKDEGLLWKDNLKSFLSKQNDFIPNTVIITGGPFMHFGITKWLKKMYNCNVILDYRDPFATNPGFKNDKISIMVKRYFERSFNKQADAIVTVNSYCAKIIEGFDKKRNAIIQNGYDENVEIEIKKPELSAELTFVYTGKFYFDPVFLVRATQNKGGLLNYYGADGERIDDSFKGVKEHGLVSYKDSINAIAKSDVGIIQTYGEDFQSTTKLFDYIRCKKPILIISDKYLNRGSINDELKDYPNVFWSRNSQKEIEKTIDEIRNHEYIEPKDDFVNEYSRGRQMEKLIELIYDLNEAI